jgi:HEAT repeat protein
MRYHLPNIRVLLTEGFTEADLRNFCFETPEFRPVHHELAELSGKAKIVGDLVKFADHKELLPFLLAWAEEQNPAKYELYQPYYTDTPPEPSQREEFRLRYLAQMIDRHQDLDFVGIPELKDRQALHLEEIFINLQTEVEIVAEPAELIETVRQDEPVTIRRLRTGGSPSKETVKRCTSANEVLREHHRLVILGDPGAGKTTLLKYITLAFAQGRSDRLDLPDEERLPIFVQLYDYVAKRAGRTGDYSLVDYLYTHAHESLMLDLPAGSIETELAQGNCCVCLDGLDELGSAGLRREVTAAVAALANRYPNNRYLVTSRVVGYNEAPLDRRDFIHFTVLPFNEDDIRRFVNKWYAAREKDPNLAHQQAERLTKTVMAEPRLKDLATNPLMLTIIALVHRIEAELPHERVKLYDKCITALVETWEQVKRLSLEDWERPYYRKRRQLLEQLAFWLQTEPLAETGGAGRAREIAEGDLIAQLVQFLLADSQLKLDKRSAWEEAEDFVAMAKTRTGLLVERGEGVYSFAHLTFQEYLAAAYIEYEHVHSIDDIWAVIQPHLHEPAWREVILLLLGSLNKFRKHPTALMSHIFESFDKYEPVLHRHLYLAARALADRVQVDMDLHNTIVDKLLAIACFDWLGRNDAMTALGALPGDNRAAKGLQIVALNKSMDAWVRYDAAEALARLGQANEAAILLLALARDETVDAWVRYAAAEALGRLGWADEAATLLLALTRAESVAAGVRYDAAEALGRLGRVDEVVLSDLLALAHNEAATAAVRYDAAETLGRLGHANEAANLLLTLARDEAVDPWVRYDAAEALGRLGQADEAIISGLLALACDEAVAAGVRYAAAEALGRSGQADEAVISGLLTLAHDETVDAGSRRAAAEAVGRLGRVDEVVLSGLLALAQNEAVAAGVRYAAAEALGRLNQIDEAANLLLALAQDGTVVAGARYDAAEALGRLGQADKAANLLLALAGDEAIASRVRYAAAEALGRLGWADEIIISGLLALVCNKALDPWGRRAAAESLGRLGQSHEAIISGLLALAQDEAITAGARYAAAEALGRLGQADQAANLLLALASDKNVVAGVRRDAAEALGRLGWADETVLSGLLELASNEAMPAGARYAAYQSLKTLLEGGWEKQKRS